MRGTTGQTLLKSGIFLGEKLGKWSWCLLYDRHLVRSLQQPMKWHLNSCVTDAETEAEQHCQGHRASTWPSQAWNPGLLSSRALPAALLTPANFVLPAAQPRPEQRWASVILCPWLIILSLGPGGRAETREAAGFGASRRGFREHNLPRDKTKQNNAKSWWQLPILSCLLQRHLQDRT